MSSAKACAKCKLVWPENAFYTRSSKCKSCAREERRDRYWADPDKAAEQFRKWYWKNTTHDNAKSKEWRDSHKGDVRVYGHMRRALERQRTIVGFTAEQLEARFSMWGGRCSLCHMEIPEGDLHIGHYKPLAAGGSHVLSNLRPMHATCNLQAGARWPIPDHLRCLCGGIYPSPSDYGR